MNFQSRVTWLDNATHHGLERELSDVTYLVMHSTASDKTATAKGVIGWMNGQPNKISYHYVIDRSGEIIRMTKPTTVAYHAGDSMFPNPRRATPENQKPHRGASINAKSIGIAWVNNNHAETLTANQVESGLWLCHFWMRKLGLAPSNVITHAECSPGRKTDPRTMPGREWREMLADTVGLYT